MNRFVGVGRLTKNVELKYTQNGKAVANFTLAVNRPFKNSQTGETDADFIMCQAWGKQAENLAQYMGKGSQVGIDGRIQTRSYDGQDGKRVYVTEVVADSVQFLESRSSNRGASTDGGQGSGNNQQGQDQNQQQEPNQNQSSQNNKNENLEPIDISDDDLPF